MTTLVEDITEALEALTPAGGVWYGANTAENAAVATVPYIIFLRVVSVVNNSLSGRSDLQKTRVQIDVLDRTYSRAQALAGQVVAAIASAFPQSTQLSVSDTYEPVVKAYRISSDFSIWATN